MNINNNYASIYGFYSNLFQNTMSMYNNKLSKMMGAVNNALSGSALSSGSVKYAGDIKSHAGKLKSLLKELTGGGAWNKKSMVSSDEEVMSVEYLGSRPGSTKALSVKIDQIAAGQINEGSSLKSDEDYGSSGTNKFSIEVAGKKTELSINIANSDTNKDVQQKMADAINSAGAGVRASVVVDSETNKSSLKIEANGTGDEADNKFTIKDISGNAVARTGADNITQTAQDAIYSVDGGAQRTSKSNTIDLGNSISVTLKKASDEAVTVSQGIDKNYGKNLVKEMVNTFNELYSTAEENAAGDAKALKLMEKLAGTAKTYSGILSAIGINVNNDGRLSIDTDKLGTASKNGQLEKYFTENSGKSYGFTNQLNRLAGDIEKNLSNYVSKQVLGDELTQNFAYSSLGDILQYNYLSAGSILDYSF